MTATSKGRALHPPFLLPRANRRSRVRPGHTPSSAPSASSHRSVAFVMVPSEGAWERVSMSGLPGFRTRKLIRRRHFIAGAGATVMGALAGSHSAKTQVDAPRSPATPLIRPASMILKNGRIITVDPGSTIAQAIAIAADRIIAVGSNDEMATHTSPATRVIDLEGKTVVPGLTDGHAHMDREALRNIFPSLGRVRSIHDIQDRIAELARIRKPGEWIVTMPIGDPPFYFDVPDILAEKRWPV